MLNDKNFILNWKKTSKTKISFKYSIGFKRNGQTITTLVSYQVQSFLSSFKKSSFAAILITCTPLALSATVIKSQSSASPLFKASKSVNLFLRSKDIINLIKIIFFGGFKIKMNCPHHGSWKKPATIDLFGEEMCRSIASMYKIC